MRLTLAAGKRGKFFPDVAEIVLFPKGGRGRAILCLCSAFLLSVL